MLKFYSSYDCFIFAQITITIWRWSFQSNWLFLVLNVLGCFEPESNHVLVLDTARFKYPSYFVDAKLLFESMKPVDKVTSLSRGYMGISKGKGGLNLGNKSSLYRNK
jgi:hypothetical protein